MRARRSHSRCGAGKRSGLTLTELLVSTGVLAMIILMTGGMLTQTQRTIRRAQVGIKANANARAVAARLRDDIESMLQDGILVIMRDYYGGPRLLFLTVGRARSMCDDGVYGNATRIEWGLQTDDMGTRGDKSDDIKTLYRRAVVLNPEDPVSGGFADDHERTCLSYYHFSPQLPLMGLNEWLYSPFDKMYTFAMMKMDPEERCDSLPYILNAPWDTQTSIVPSVTFPINTLDDVKNLWPLMLSGVTEMSIEWTDGRTKPDGTLEWYGAVGDNGRVVARDNNWLIRNFWSRYGPRGVRAPEYDFGKGDSRIPMSLYTAAWCFDRKDLWPRAIRVQFKVGEGPHAQSHDIIVSLPDMHQEPENAP